MRDFVIEVKEREAGEPCWLLVAPNNRVGLAPNEHIAIEMPSGSALSDAQELAHELMNRAQSIRIVKL